MIASFDKPHCSHPLGVFVFVESEGARGAPKVRRMPPAHRRKREEKGAP
jgi:hypothetical protein